MLNVFAEQLILNAWKDLGCQRHCQISEKSSWNRNYQGENIVYEATITCNEQNYGENIYVGIVETKFKKDIVTIKDLLV